MNPSVSFNEVLLLVVSSVRLIEASMSKIDPMLFANDGA
jgi:hypothetical protein